MVVKALHFNTRFLGELLERVESGLRPEDAVPPEIVFTPGELDRMEKEIRAVTLPAPLLRRMEFFAAQFELFEPGGRTLEYLTKDTVKLAALSFESFGRRADLEDLGAQTRNGLSVRALMTCLVFAKALAWFRGNAEVSFDDVRQILPFVLHDKLVREKNAAFFDAAENAPYRSDLVGWIRVLFDRACQEYDRLGRDTSDPVRAAMDLFDEGLEGLDEATVDARLASLEQHLRSLEKGAKLYGHLYDDVLAVKYLHQRYTNYRAWLRARAGSA